MNNGQISDLTLDIINFPAFKDMKVKTNDFTPSIQTIKDFQTILCELNCLCNHMDPKTPLNIPIDFTMKSLLNMVYDMGGRFSDNIPVWPDGTVQDGSGFIYCGTASKPFEIGDYLEQEKTDRFIKVFQKVCSNYPIIMLSLVSPKDPTVENYYYFKIISPKNKVEKFDFKYVCTQISDNSVNGNSFAHYMSKELTNAVYYNTRKEYSILDGDEDNKPVPQKELDDLPMGTIVEYKDIVLVKNGYLGESSFWRAFFRGH